MFYSQITLTSIELYANINLRSAVLPLSGCLYFVEFLDAWYMYSNSLTLPRHILSVYLSLAFTDSGIGVGVNRLESNGMKLEVTE